MARKPLDQRIKEKKVEIKKVRARILEDQGKLEVLEGDLKNLESDQVFEILNNHRISVTELNQILKKNQSNKSYENN